MGRGVVDFENMDRADIVALRSATPGEGLPFRVTKLGHVVLKVQDVERSVAFYTKILGFRVSDVYPESMVPGRMVFLRCNADHHCLALVGGATGPNSFAELHHLAFEVGSLDELYRARKHLREQGVNGQIERTGARPFRWRMPQTIRRRARTPRCTTRPCARTDGVARPAIPGTRNSGGRIGVNWSEPLD